MSFKMMFALPVALLLGVATLQAQTAPKYGHMNLGNLLELLPDTKKANDELAVFARNLSMQDSLKTVAFQMDYQQLEKEYNAGGLSQVQVQQRQAELQKKQEEIQKFEEQAQKDIAAKREQSLKPILDKVEQAIKAVAKESGYLMVFDTSGGALLFAGETDDVTALVKKKLGI